MNCIATHKPLHTPVLSTHNISIGDFDTMTSIPKNKLLSQKAMNALLPDFLMFSKNNNNSARLDPSSAKKLSKSFAHLELLVREAQVQTTCGASMSMSKLDKPIKAGNRGVPTMDPLTHNAVFTIHIRGAPKAALAPRRRRPHQEHVVKNLRKVAAHRRTRTRELKLDDMGRLCGMMEEFRKQKKSGKYNYDFHSDSDDEDLDV